MDLWPRRGDPLSKGHLVKDGVVELHGAVNDAPKRGHVLCNILQNTLQRSVVGDVAGIHLCLNALLGQAPDDGLGIPAGAARAGNKGQVARAVLGHEQSLSSTETAEAADEKIGRVRLEFHIDQRRRGDGHAGIGRDAEDQLTDMRASLQLTKRLRDVGEIMDGNGADNSHRIAVKQLHHLGHQGRNPVRMVYHHMLQVATGKGGTGEERAHLQRAVAHQVHLADLDETAVGGQAKPAPAQRLSGKRVDNDIDTAASCHALDALLE